jgi:hypothetical protein
LKIYAAIIAGEKNWQEMELHLTHLHLETDEETTMSLRVSRTELQEFFESTLAVWFEWLETEAAWISLRNESLAETRLSLRGLSRWAT